MEKAGSLMSSKYSVSEQEIQLSIAREAIKAAVMGKPLPAIDLDSLPSSLAAEGASFVTLTIEGRLRGCIGTLEAYQPVAIDVQEHAVAAALQDTRFPTLQPSELPLIKIEISILTPRRPLIYSDPIELEEKLRPGIDGVVLQDGFRKATFLPQVWEKIPDTQTFLTQLCMKMGAPGNLWQKKPLQVYIYQVTEFHE